MNRPYGCKIARRTHFLRYVHFCNVLYTWSVRVIPTYRVYRLWLCSISLYRPRPQAPRSYQRTREKEGAWDHLCDVCPYTRVGREAEHVHVLSCPRFCTHNRLFKLRLQRRSDKGPVTVSISLWYCRSCWTVEASEQSSLGLEQYETCRLDFLCSLYVYIIICTPRVPKLLTISNHRVDNCACCMPYAKCVYVTAMAVHCITHSVLHHQSNFTS